MRLGPPSDSGRSKWTHRSSYSADIPRYVIVSIYKPPACGQQMSSNFLACLQNTGVKYNIYVDDLGTTVVLPTGPQDVDFDCEDQEHCKCIIDVNHCMKLAAESTEYYQHEHETAAPSSAVAHKWLSEKGLLGKTPIGTRHPKAPTGDSSG